MAKQKPPEKIPVASNRKARFHFEILETYEAGMSLKGPEVKSLRKGQTSFEGTYARVDDKGLFLHKLYIAPYSHNTGEEINPTRTRKLLMRAKELKALRNAQDSQGLTLVALEIYFKNGWAKVTIALARGNKAKDKRSNLKKKDQARELQRSFKGKFKL
jgi:SsrA-binding protein